MRRAVLGWIAVLALVAGTATAGVLVLGATVFGAAGFVRVYLDAVARGDAAGALALPGVTAAPGLRTELLADDVLAGFELGALAERPGADGTVLVTATWTAGDVDAVTTFTVVRTGSRVGLFPEWRFAVSPVATLELAVAHDERFDVNGVAARSGVAAPDAVAYAVLVPGVYRVDHHSRYLRADAIDLVATRPDSTIGATLEVEPADALVELVTGLVHDDLRECAEQEVLFPTGCPLGHPITDLVASPPEWSIVELPEIALEPDAEFGVWRVPPVTVVAHLRVDVRSLFDGSVTTFDEELRSTAAYRVTLLDDDTAVRLDPVAPGVDG